jgi:hypothetical protein
MWLRRTGPKMRRPNGSGNAWIQGNDHGATRVLRSHMAASAINSRAIHVKTATLKNCSSQINSWELKDAVEYVQKELTGREA